MRYLIAIASLACALTAQVSFAADMTCEAQAAEKKLAGAAKNSFVKKCTTDSMTPAEATCSANAAEKKLAGAAKNSYMKKCVADAK